MKKLLYIFIMVLFASCSIETSDNGDFDGFWHLERVDTINTGNSADLSKDYIFWGVQDKLIQLEADSMRYFFRFAQSSDSIVLSTPYVSKPNDAGWQGADTLLTDPTPLNHFGVEGLEVHYHKDQLSGSRMVLRSPKLVLHFRKF